jgi:hypothetical protein
MNDRAAALEAIKQLKARYFRGVDTKDFALLRAVFADDCVADYRNASVDPPSGIQMLPGGTDAPIEGGEAIARWIIDSMQPILSVHHGHMPEITLTGDASAEGIWAMEDRLYFPGNAEMKGVAGYGHYYESYACIEGAWKIRRIKLVRLKVDALS